MGLLSRFENRMEDTLEGAASKLSAAPISPVQISKKAEKQMRREKIVGAGKQYAPTLYTVLVNEGDDRRLFGYYPTLAGEIETYLSAKAVQEGLFMDGQPLVRFIPDENLKSGKFEVIAEPVAAPIIEQLRAEEMERYGLKPRMNYGRSNYGAGAGAGAGAAAGASSTPYNSGYGYTDEYDAYEPARPQIKEPLPYVPEDEIDYSIDYGEYTFNSQDFEDYRQEEDIEFGNSFFEQYDNYGNNYEDDPYAPQTAPQTWSEQPAENEFPQTMAFEAGANANATATPDQSLVRAVLHNVPEDRTHMLGAARLILGRATTCDIVVSDISVSRNHAELVFEPQGVWVITDLGSANGTYVNDRRITSCELNDGDAVTVGTTDFIFSLA